MAPRRCSGHRRSLWPLLLFLGSLQQQACGEDPVADAADAPEEAPTAPERFRRGHDLAIAGNVEELDDWKPIVPMAPASEVSESLETGSVVLEKAARYVSGLLVLGTIGVGVVARIREWLPKNRADNLRTICFIWLLPAFLLRHIWLVQVEKDLYVVAAWSLGFHCLWSALSCRAAQAMEPQDRQMRGWTMLMSQGSMNSFLYPLLLTHDDFGEKSLACAVLWDLGGNMWVCQFGLFAIAAFFKPSSALADGSPLYQKLQAEDLEDLFLNQMDEENVSTAMNGNEEDEEMEEWSEPIKEAPIVPKLRELPDSVPPTELSTLEALAAGFPKEILFTALKQPVLVCSVLGFVFNLAKLPLPVVADTPLWIVGEPYKMVLYFLVGYYGDHKVKSHEVGRMARVLGVRYAVSLTIVVVVAAVLPLTQLYRYTVILALLSPCSSYPLFLVADQGYGEGLVRLTVCCGFASTIFSTFAQNLCLGFMSAS